MTQSLSSSTAILIPKKNTLLKIPMETGPFSFIETSPEMHIPDMSENPVWVDIEFTQDYTWRVCIEKNWTSLDSISVNLEKEKQHREVRLKSVQELKEPKETNLAVPGVYTKEERMAKIRKYKAKKQSKHQKPYKYTVRRRFAQSRPRVRGRFIRHYN